MVLRPSMTFDFICDLFLEFVLFVVYDVSFVDS